MKNLFLLGLLSLTLQASAQPFEQTMSETKVDFNHYSIENTAAGDYILAGTKFDNSTGNNDIHIFRLDASGTVIWEKQIDVSSDDRALDIVEDDQQNIVVCGYVYAGPGGSIPIPYVVKLDANGNIMGDVLISGNMPMGACTNIIFSQGKQAYIVGGFFAGNFQVPLVNNEAFVCELPMNLSSGPNWLTTFSGPNKQHSSINDIVEVPKGFFVTGSFDFNSNQPGFIQQGVLAQFIDFGGNPTFDRSFNSSNSTHVGVSAVYIPVEDCIYLMSNNSGFHNPQLTKIAEVSTIPALTASYYLELDPSYGSMNAAGFELRQSITDPNNLVAAGYFRHYPNIYDPNTTTWLAEFNKSTGANITTWLRPASSPNFQTQGGQLFAAFYGQSPYIYNPEILAYRPDGKGYCYLGPTTIGTSPDFCLQIMSATVSASTTPVPGTPVPNPCLSPYSWKNINLSHWAEPCMAQVAMGNITNLSASPFSPNTSIQNTCAVAKPTTVDDASIGKAQKKDISVYPNPTDGIVQLNLNLQTFRQVTLRFYDVLGREVLTQKRLTDGGTTRLQIDISELKAGVYLIRVSDSEGSNYPSLSIQKK